jgi:hypothetical protein
MPPDPQAERFEPPAGMTGSSAGLYTEDIYAWTWPLGDALRFTTEASGLPLANLRRRVGVLMTRMGGTSAFGPPAISRQQSRLRRLELHTSYRKLPNDAAFQAMREVIGELEQADAIDPRAIQHILVRSGGFSSGVPTLPPIPRHIGVPAPNIPDNLRLKRGDAWFGAAETDAIRPLVEDQVVLAATAIHERSRFRDALVVQQYFGPVGAECGDSLFDQLQYLPRVVVGDRTMPQYEDLAQGAVVWPRPTIADSVELYQIMLCPRVADQLGWHANNRNLFEYRDHHGEVVAQTLFWRDGGIRRYSTDDEIHRRGYLLLVRADRASHLTPYLSSSVAARAWRVNKNDD